MFIRNSIATVEEQHIAVKTVEENESTYLILIRAILCGDKTWDDLRELASRHKDIERKTLSEGERAYCAKIQAIWDKEARQAELDLDAHELGGIGA